MKHEGCTPGPWRIKEATTGKAYRASHRTFDVFGASYVATIGPLGADSVAVAESNARLIADAPRLAEENERLREALEEIAELDLSGEQIRHAVAKHAISTARAALSRREKPSSC